ncbi:major facilitator superfamily transporter [Phaeosphaeria sp. MPI-PUGE-AT-0046c]|nr:major facilitator superfamily transporter [Phaeosphaeria sp. MPI-PUGE-AT-0046c]
MATRTKTIESSIADTIQLRQQDKDGSSDAPETPGGVESGSGTTDEAPDYPTGIEFWFITIMLGALLILGALDINIVATAVPSITNDFHTVSDVGWYSSAFRLCCCAFQFVFGKMYKVFSVKCIFLFANAIFTFGSLICATATSSKMFVVGRAFTGAGFAGLIGGIFTVITYILPLRKRPFYCGILGGVEAVAMLVAPILGGVLTQSIGWRWCFWINLPMGGATFLMLMLLFSDPKPSDKSISFRRKLILLDPVSNLLFIPGLTSLFLALSWAGTKYPWNDGKVIGLLVTFAVLVTTFSFNQRRLGDNAALPPRILKNRNVVASAIFALCSQSAIQVLEYYLPTKSGYMMTPIVVGSMLGLFLCGSGTSILGYYTPFMLFSSFASPVFAGLITTFGVRTEFVRLILYTGASGLASGLAFNVPFSAVQTVLSTEDVSMGLSIVLFAQHFGPAVSVAIAQVIFTNQLSSNLDGLMPNVTSRDIGDSGLMEIAGRAPPVLHSEVLGEISRSLSTTWYVAVGYTCATLVGSLLMEWRSVKVKKT